MIKDAQIKRMRNVKIKSSLLSGLCVLCLLFAGWIKGGLKDIAKPYVGEYECKKAMMNRVDCLEKFDYIRLELKHDGTYALNFCEKSKEKSAINGTYEYDDKTHTMIFKIGAGQGYQRKFPIKDGKIFIVVPFADKTLAMEFQQK